MIRLVGLVCLIAGMTQGCAGDGQWDELRGATRKELPPINVGGTIYKVFELARSKNPEATPQTDPEATKAVFAIVAPGTEVYCGVTVSGCERAIREFKIKQHKAKSKKKLSKAKSNKKPYKARKEVLDGM